MKIKKRTLIELSLGVAITIWVAMEAVEEYRANSEIGVNEGMSTGVIVDYKIVGAHSHYVSYEYYVDNIKYHKSVSASRVFRGCQKTKECIGRKFKVYYSTKNPEKSYMDFDEEVVEQ